MRSIIAGIVELAVILLAGVIAIKYGVDPTGYTIGSIVASFAHGFAAGIKERE